MEMKWLEDVLSLSTTLSFSRSARDRNVTQSALSRRVKQLEEWLGLPLFDRSSYPVRVTEAGETFLSHAREILKHVQTARLEARQQQDRTSETVVLATLSTLSLTYFPGLVQRVEEKLGPVRTRFCDQLSSFDGNVAFLNHGECDFLLTYAHPAVPPELDAERFLYCCLGTEQAIPVSVPDARGEPLHAVRRGGAPVRLLSYGSCSFFARRLTLLFAERPTPLVTIYENPMSVGLKAMVLAGRGVAWVPESLVADELRTGQVVPAADSSWYIDAEIRLYRARQRNRMPVERFWSAVTEDQPARPEGKVRQAAARRGYTRPAPTGSGKRKPRSSAPSISASRA